MLATLVIGLREGLEASLIVGIIAAFLTKNGKSLTAMWLGVAFAVILSVAVGVALDLVEQALPQAAQEGMETVIGAVAIVFVTGMIAWMNAHARDMKRQLEAEAAEALGEASTWALASMAFLAVLKEGFETSVFLLATFSAAQSAVLAAAGAVIGLLLAVVIGWGIYVGGVKINLSRFFRFTGAFLILVAAGLVVSALRTAHEAGWLNAGQQPVVNLAWAVRPGTVQSSLITGVLGIPADPRLVEVIGWLAYLIPVAVYIYWPQSRMPGRRLALRLRFAAAVVLALGASGLAILYPAPRLDASADAALVSTADASPRTIGTASLTSTVEGLPTAFTLALGDSGQTTLPLPAASMRTEQHLGLDALSWSLADDSVPQSAPSTLSLDDLVGFSGGRIPVGFNAKRHPGPFAAKWTVHRAINLWAINGALLDAVGQTTTVVTLSGGGLQTPRTLTVDDAGKDRTVGNWQASAEYRDRVASALDHLAAARTEYQFWARLLPVALLLAALLLAVHAGRGAFRLRRTAVDANPHHYSRNGRRADPSLVKGARHVAH